MKGKKLLLYRSLKMFGGEDDSHHEIGSFTGYGTTEPVPPQPQRQPQRQREEPAPRPIVRTVSRRRNNVKMAKISSISINPDINIGMGGLTIDKTVKKKKKPLPGITLLKRLKAEGRW